VTAGDAIEAFVEWDAADGEAYFEIDNLTSGTGIYFIQYTDTGFTGTGSTAEWIVERTEESGNYPALLCPERERAGVCRNFCFVAMLYGR
jgi:hypothetical protein